MYIGKIHVTHKIAPFECQGYYSSKNHFYEFLIFLPYLHIITASRNVNKGEIYMKATGIVRRIDDLGRVVIPKEIRRTMRIREGDPLQITLTSEDVFVLGMIRLGERKGWK